MDSESEMPTPPAEAKRKAGRPRISGTETQQQRIERLQAELRAAQDALKLAEERRASIVGAAAVRHARKNDEFRRALAAALRVEIKSKAELAAVADLLLERDAAPAAS